MRIILLNRIPKLGRIGDVVSVRDGFARNYLLPRQRALRATPENVASFEARRDEIEALNLKQLAAAEEIAEALEGKVIVSIQNAGENNQLYGSVSAREIANILGEQNISIHHSQVILDTPIKTLGLHPVKVNLHGDISATIVVNAARNEEEAEHQFSRVKAEAQKERKAVKEIPEGSPKLDAGKDEPRSGQSVVPLQDSPDEIIENQVV